MAAVAIDTNLLLLLMAGRVAKKLIGNHRRLREFVEDDYELLQGLVRNAKRILVTPQILTETSNLIGHMPSLEMVRMRSVLKGWTSGVVEHATLSSDLMEHQYYPSLGLTDAGILSLPEANVTVLTVDFDLWAACRKAGITAYNFNHIRDKRRTV